MRGDLFIIFLPTSDESPPSPDEADYERFNKLIRRGKQYVGEGRIAEALECNKKALQISYSEKLARKIKKMEVNSNSFTVFNLM